MKHYEPVDDAAAAANWQPGSCDDRSRKAEGNWGWFDLLKKKSDETVYQIVANIFIELEHDPAWRDVFYFDELQHQLILARPIPDRAGGGCWDGLPRQWRESDSTDALRWFSLGDYPGIGIDKIDLAIRNFAETKCRVHRLRDYLVDLQWDGEPRIGRWLFTYCHAEADTDEQRAFIEAVGLKWLVSAVARIYQPGCQADHCLVLEGEQGIGKTSTFRILGGEWFSENLPGDLHSKDAADHIRGKWIIELSELLQLGRSRTETIKTFLSRENEKFRPAYARYEVNYPRQCVFGGSTNQATYFHDETGGRRLWPVKIGRVDLRALARDRDQLWAEAVHLYHSGEPWWLTDERLIATAADEQAARYEADSWQGAISRHLENLRDDQTVTASKILTDVIGIQLEHQRQVDKRRVTSILANLGYRQAKKTRRERPWAKSNRE
jgi:predicted P-loop ATPase